MTISGADSASLLVFIPGLFGSNFGFRKVVPPLNAAGYRTIVIEPSVLALRRGPTCAP